jgi:Uma2 family endonuclease
MPPSGYTLFDEAGWMGRQEMAVEMAAARRLFTREEYHRMGEVGILKPTDRVELIRGEIVEMSPIGRRHYAFVNNLSHLLIMGLAGRAIVAVQGPIVLADDTEPESDLAVIRRRIPPYKEREAHKEDAFLLIEVAESSLAYDRSTKLRLYAAAGIPEYWVVDCVGEHRGPPHASRRRLSGRRACCRRNRDGHSAGIPRRRAGARRDLRLATAPSPLRDQPLRG